jgi:CO/xanthine dehydrogenase Mo-binding subunit
MGMEGIGARVARKEDKRFITGKGRYTDDMSVPGMKHAAFRPFAACSRRDQGHRFLRGGKRCRA